MTVRKRSGANFIDGFSWHVSVPYNVKDFIPCFELEWDDKGHVTRTGRRALLDNKLCNFSQQEHKEPSRQVDDDDPRICTKDEYRTRFVALNDNHRDLTGVPERLQADG